jgi:hypothetical protein
MKKVIFLLLIGVIIGYYVKMNNVIPQNIAQFIPAAPQKAVAGASTSLVANNMGAIQKQAGNLPMLTSLTSSPQVQMILQLGKNIFKIK